MSKKFSVRSRVDCAVWVCHSGAKLVVEAEQRSGQEMRALLFSILFITCGIWQAVADDTPVFHLCLNGSDDPVTDKKSNAACAAYLRRLMQGVRFGIGREQLERPFCLPKGKLNSEQLKLLHAKILADNPDTPPHLREVLPSVIILKAEDILRCPASN